ncbi:MAG TPA: deoxyguanosinetriphosphate triphosphohydrolase [Planctomycetota bacterium]|jgi:dGTPase|nr:deoxyguanosinetriphosphate triphosphohydrolase [Planctomycetota bacterium]
MAGEGYRAAPERSKAEAKPTQRVRLYTREAKEEREEHDLAPYAMRARRSRGRKHPEEPDPFRMDFERDRDRIVHSTAFRRMEYKTQVFVNHEGDYYRTRLTHTLEVVQVARSVASALGLNEPLVETIALAHDLGHPPFGHKGEETLDALMREHGGFRHNRQVLRIVDLLEKRAPGYDGLNLTREVRESLLKGERKTAPEAAEFEPLPQVLLEAQLVDAADETAYTHHDVDDGLKAGIFTEEELDALAIWRRARARVETPGLPSRLRARRTVRALIGILIQDLIEHSARAIAQAGFDSPEGARRAAAPAIGHSPEIREEIAPLRTFLHQNFYHHYRVNRMMAKAREMLERLFRAYVGNPRILPPDFQRWAEREGLQRGVCDYVAGMTDRFAADEYRRLFDPFERA